MLLLENIRPNQETVVSNTPTGPLEKPNLFSVTQVVNSESRVNHIHRFIDLRLGPDEQVPVNPVAGKTDGAHLAFGQEQQGGCKIQSYVGPQWQRPEQGGEMGQITTAKIHQHNGWGWFPSMIEPAPEHCSSCVRNRSVLHRIVFEHSPVGLPLLFEQRHRHHTITVPSG